MVKIIVAFVKDERSAQVSATLEGAGFNVFRRCTSASEVKRAINQCGDGILITSCKLPDSTIDSLAWDLGNKAVILATGSPAQLELCEHPDIFKLTFPCSKGELTSAVNMLMQLHRMRLPHKSADEKQTIQRAKEHLMEKHHLSEPEAHHLLQKGAMDKGMKMAEFAAKLLEANGV